MPTSSPTSDYAEKIWFALNMLICCVEFMVAILSDVFCIAHANVMSSIKFYFVAIFPYPVMR